MSYELKIQSFQGPLEKLLSLIEARQMDITEISLAEVTNDFLHYLDELRKAEVGDGDKHEHLRLMADFVVVASRLVFIKSKSLLPDLTLTETEEDDIKDLEKRLHLYREMRPAIRNIGRLWQRREAMFGRAYLSGAGSWLGGDGTAKLFYPGGNVTSAALAENLGRMMSVFETLIREAETIQGTVLTLEEKIAQITSELASITRTSFRDLAGTQSRAERIVTFLALLHLVREQRIEVEQAGHLSDIIITKHGS